VIGHALAFAPRPATQRAWERAISIGFSIGSLCFLVGPFPGFVELVGTEADAAVFFAGSLFFTFAAALELREGTARRGRRWGRDASWWSAAVQFAGTLLFNLSTFDALQDSLSAHEEDRLVWAPDALGSIAFLASGVLAYAVAARAGRHDRDWTMAAINLAGCVLFGVSAVGAYIVPDTGSIFDLAAANWGTSLGALCFLIGAVMVYPRAGR
jgi:hypothetical protein